MQLHPPQADVHRSSAMLANTTSVLSFHAPHRTLQLHPSQADVHRSSAMLANTTSVLSFHAPHRTLQLHPSQADVHRSSAMLANTTSALSSHAPHRPLQLHPSRTDAHRPPAMPASTSGGLPPQAAALPLQLHRPQVVAPRPSAVPASASAEGALTPRVAPQMRTAQQHAKATATSSPPNRAVRSEIEYHKKQKPDTGTLAKQAAAQAVSQVSAQLEAMKVELSTASQAVLPDLDRFVDQVYRELESKIKFERQRSGL
ncbi:hypothetical protein AV654_02950 [Paenibacillus elgii]|uniref:Uncharacterized protein n=1 Tax=Paenibacillus elgii TaxID=189691 RepID=A0A163WQ58_9BACL|nr:hypothetical protein AV654_02950 [Paenibacillus elgii]